ncbi:DUF1842 domain-containing protein [Kordia sp.]|uniref:DUF1842 domain-containing protein n=1 Tax=Kordia sp. TaxID=1965332 RepID=UPI003D6C28E0
MSTQIIRGTMGSTVNLNSAIIKFNLTAGSDRQVHGSVEVTLGNPEDKPYKGNVTGTLYPTGFGKFDKVVSIHGDLPSHNPLTPLNFPFSANMALEADGDGIGGFNFRGEQQEELPITYKSMEL